ncbi:MAG TPA: hypothetical protein VFT22_15860 [Kofleriaceae bacterium]|nr:hypothetical protein [Kofleriaceae bacterium]
MRWLCVLAFVIATPRAVHAGMCPDDYGEQALRAIESYAGDPSKGRPDLWPFCMEQVIAVQPNKAARFLAACDKIVQHDPTYPVCVQWAIQLGRKQLGKLDLFDLVEQAFTLDPLVWETKPPLLYAKLDDPRAVARLVAAWKAQAAKRPPKAPWQQEGWERFRRGTAKFLGKRGGATEKAFLEEQLAATRDAGIAGAIRSAIAAIDARAAAGVKP